MAGVAVALGQLRSVLSAPDRASWQSRSTLPTMKTVEDWHWLIPTPRRGGVKTVKSRYRMGEAAALEAHPGTIRAPSSMELHSLPYADADTRANFTRALMRAK